MRKLKGTIVSNKMTKTIVVIVRRLKKHQKYLKYFRASSRFKVHVDDEKKYSIGDVVIIGETRPISKDKRWKILEVVKKAEVESADELIDNDEKAA